MMKITLSDNDKRAILRRLERDFWNDYIQVAEDIIQGKYGNGIERIKRLEQAGYDYDIAQTIVDYVLS